MTAFPTKQELEQVIKDGKLCLRCNKNPATIENLQGAWMIADCESCKEKAREEARKRPKDNSMGTNNVASVWEHPSGALIPVNERGNVIHSPNKNSIRQKRGEKPLW